MNPTIISPDDQKALDALIDSGFEISKISEDLRPRAEKMLRLLQLLDRLSAPNASDQLTEQTLERIAVARQQHRFNQQLEKLRPIGPIAPWRDVVAVAAMILIGMSVLLSVMQHSRAAARQALCQSNLAAAGMGLSNYANDNRGQMPSLSAQPGTPWWFTGQTAHKEGQPVQSNSAHLYLVVRQGYVRPEALSCPDNPAAPQRLDLTAFDWPDDEAVSFSYQNQYGPTKPRMDGPTIAVLGDKNPFFRPGQFLSQLPKDTVSPNHRGLGGQNVLLTNGSVMWISTPQINGDDNVFQARGLSSYNGTEAPTDPTDSFLVH